MTVTPGVDLSKAELVEWEVEGKEGRTRIRVGEGATLEVRQIITGVMRIGNDPNTGLPTYNVSAQVTISLVSCDKRLRKPVLKQPGAGEGTASTGVG
jgi:hypothetical protein